MGKVALVTGASSGIGEIIVKTLIKNGIKVVGLARKIEKMKETEKGLKSTNIFFPIKCDLTKEDNILNAFEWIKKHLGGVDILVNCAGVLSLGLIIGEKI